MFEKFDIILEFIRNYYQRPQGGIGLHEPVFKGNERRYVLDAIDSTYVSSVGAYVDRFESMMKQQTGAEYAIATSNGTAALHISLLLAGVRANDLVITQPLTFIATCNAISYIGASPFFVDVDLQNLGLSSTKLRSLLSEQAIIKDGNCYHLDTGRRISACVPMHTFGHSADLNELMNVCEEFHLKLVEDAAESLGSLYKGKHTGTFGLLGAFSLNGNKTITSGGGGVIVTNDETLGRMAKHLTTQSKVKHAWEFTHDQIGYNYRMPNLNAALACGQMEMLDRIIFSKRTLANLYRDLFRDLRFEFIDEPAGTTSNFWLNSFLVPDRSTRDSFLAYSNEREIFTRPAWTLMNKLEMFKNCLTGDLTNAIDLENRLVSLPSSPKI